MVVAVITQPGAYSEYKKPKRIILIGPRQGGRATILRFLGPRHVGLTCQRFENPLDWNGGQRRLRRYGSQLIDTVNHGLLHLKTRGPCQNKIILSGFG